MRPVSANVLAGLAALLLSTLGAPACAQSRFLAIVDATVIDGTGAGPLTHATVLMDHGRITCVGSAAACPVPRGAQVISGRGRWVIPGLFDAHVHISEEPGNYLPLYLAFGITSVRDMGGYVDSLKMIRAAVASGARAGPRVYLAGRPLDGDPPRWPSLYPNVPRVIRSRLQAEQAVREMVAAGADFIKLYNGLTPELLRVATAEAHRLGRKTTADLLAWEFPGDSALPNVTDGFEHLLPFLEPSRHWSLLSWDRDSVRVDSLVDRLVAQGTTLTTTLVLFDRLAEGALPTGEPTYEALPPELQERSESLLTEVTPQGEQSQAVARKLWRSAERYLCAEVRLFNAKGGTVLAGTDSYFLLSFPGDLHRELELLVECGLAPAQALAAATRRPAAWLTVDSVGALVPGAVADLVLLRADPLADIRNTRDIELIIQAGRRWDPADLLALVR